MSHTTHLEKYADLAIETGVNLQEGQALMLNAPVDGAEFARIVAKKAYERGAKNVHVNWTDDALRRMKFEHAPMEELEEVPQWQVDKLNSFAKGGAAVLSIRAENPDLLNGIEAKRIQVANKASAEAMKEFRQYTMNDHIPWSIVAIPNEEWAQKVFPESSKEEAVAKLWEQIFTITRVAKEDPIEAWNEHNDVLAQARAFMNKKQFKKLIYKSEGTNLEVELPEGHIWKGGSSETTKGQTFNPNIPTEEVFTVPHKYGVNGTVASKKPLSYGGNLIDNFSFTFENGKVVDFSAEQGEEALQNLLDMDEGARRLGELAIVPHSSPISQSGVIFYNTLYDENASCHLALGKGYPSTIKGGADMDDEQLDKNGVNNSLVHVDFMMGSADLAIDGELADGSTVPVFRNGEWAIDFD
ncbi:peptidase M29 [Pontibacillus halophilus JSM 076056 = DSM 19796]|uniref:Peptidase M29 n=1 Tax=Pontibacillus halophilus JSM 076056 = DSM 19796 TaxID=1385510 RepID=A0A0A5IDS0_9BACI|nr:aminopeptidase [Pontibacillus halophilus]KGX93982.1 peptidase M29 [Pontibacillus halophilus JSM 076056 = DSM 19796]